MLLEMLVRLVFALVLRLMTTLEFALLRLMLLELLVRLVLVLARLMPKMVLVWLTLLELLARLVFVLARLIPKMALSGLRLAVLVMFGLELLRRRIVGSVVLRCTPNLLLELPFSSFLICSALSFTIFAAADFRFLSSAARCFFFSFSRSSHRR